MRVVEAGNILDAQIIKFQIIFGGFHPFYPSAGIRGSTPNKVCFQSKIAYLFAKVSAKE